MEFSLSPYSAVSTGWLDSKLQYQMGIFLYLFLRDQTKMGFKGGRKTPKTHFGITNLGPNMLLRELQAYEIPIFVLPKLVKIAIFTYWSFPKINFVKIPAIWNSPAQNFWIPKIIQNWFVVPICIWVLIRSKIHIFRVIAFFCSPCESSKLPYKSSQWIFFSFQVWSPNFSQNPLPWPQDSHFIKRRCYLASFGCYYYPSFYKYKL